MPPSKFRKLSQLIGQSVTLDLGFTLVPAKLLEVNQSAQWVKGQTAEGRTVFAHYTGVLSH
jgi:hypothetical protein